MSQPARRDPPTCREDLIRKAATDGAAGFRSAFDWINERQELLVARRGENRGLTAIEIRNLAEEWILAGNDIKCVREQREPYKDDRHFHYDIIVKNLPDFPRGLYVEMDLESCAEDNPSARLLDAHPPTFY